MDFVIARGSSNFLVAHVSLFSDDKLRKVRRHCVRFAPESFLRRFSCESCVLGDFLPIAYGVQCIMLLKSDIEIIVDTTRFTDHLM